MAAKATEKRWYRVSFGDSSHIRCSVSELQELTNPLISWIFFFYSYSMAACNETINLLENPNAGWFIVLVCKIQKILLLLSGRLKRMGDKLEFTLNLVYLNGGIVHMVLRTISGISNLIRSIHSPTLVIPNRGSEDFMSLVSLVDGRTELHRSVSGLLSFPWAELDERTINRINTQDLCIMAAKVAYENKAYVHKVVTKHWKMHLVGFFEFYNECSMNYDTQAFIFCDRKSSIRLIVVAFRGTEIFNAADWLTDLDISWASIPGIGKVHQGFMKALGLHQAETNGVGSRKHAEAGNKSLAYYTIREKLKRLLKRNQAVKILVTGHSLGGALAILFVAKLVHEKEEAILNKLLRVYTFGQPRVGDETFRSSMARRLKGKYVRVVYRYDIVPRLPFGSPVTPFAHFGKCIYYTNWYQKQVLEKEPDENYFNPLYFIPMHWNAWMDLFRALFVGFQQGESFEENLLSLLERFVGLLIPGVSSHSPRDYINCARLCPDHT
uniref:Fungal lipase-type domain-containing protein n=1 Tax=Nelumbo nucifera TaxID=4432 RepID=A0A822XHS8_NELNU|nr:TPA_asm: hypothetical protein HUJ06_020696 [Nelumbo nucifera]